MSETIPKCEAPLPGYPRACHLIADGQEKEVYRKLLDSEMAVLLPLSMAKRDFYGKLISGGLFCVPHKDLFDRLICDRRSY